MHLKSKPFNLKSKTTTSFARTVRMYPCIEFLMILCCGKSFLNNCTMKVVIKGKKALIDKLQIDIGGIIYIQKSSFMYSRMKNVNAMTFLDLKRYYILPRYLFCGKKQILIWFTFLFAKVADFLWLHIVIYQVRQKLNSCIFFLF